MAQVAYFLIFYPLLRALKAGLKRDQSASIKKTLFPCANAIISFTSRALIPKGFSQRTAFPAARAAQLWA